MVCYVGGKFAMLPIRGGLLVICADTYYLPIVLYLQLVLCVCGYVNVVYLLDIPWAFGSYVYSFGYYID